MKHYATEHDERTSISPKIRMRCGYSAPETLINRRYKGPEKPRCPKCITLLKTDGLKVD